MTVETIPITPTLRVRIEVDRDAESPLQGEDLVNIAYLARSRYTLGNEPLDNESMGFIKEGIERGELVGLPVFAYIHGGIALRAATENPFSCQWDSGLSGYAYMTRKQAFDTWSHDRGEPVPADEVLRRALAYVTGVVDEYASFLAGEVYGFVIERLTLGDDGEVLTAEQLDSCWGFTGDINVCKEEAMQQAANFVEEEDCAVH